MVCCNNSATNHSSARRIFNEVLELKRALAHKVPNEPDEAAIEKGARLWESGGLLLLIVVSWRVGALVSLKAYRG